MKQIARKVIAQGTNILRAIPCAIPGYYLKKAQNPCWLMMFVFGRFRLVRQLIAKLCRVDPVRHYDISRSVFRNVDTDRIVQLLEQDGFCEGLYLPQYSVEKIRSFADATMCYGDGNPQLGFFYRQHRAAERSCGRGLMRGVYFNTSSCETIRSLSEDAVLLAIAAKYLRSQPVLMETCLWWSFVNDSPADLRKAARTFHYDIDDYHCLAFYFYLTDVDAMSGPHVAVRGSHLRKKIAHLLSLHLDQPDEEMIYTYGSDRIVTFLGNSGYGFAEDKYVHHKATSPVSRNRLMLRIQYGLNRYGNGNRINPEILKSCF